MDKRGRWSRRPAWPVLMLDGADVGVVAGVVHVLAVAEVAELVEVEQPRLGLLYS